MVCGRPLGIKDIPVPRHIFPESSDAEAAIDPTMLLTTSADEVRGSAERDADAKQGMNEMVRRNYIRKFKSKVQAKAFVE